MPSFGSITRTPLTTITVDERPFQVTLQVAHDGIEYVGRLWFADAQWDPAGIPDRGVLPGRTEADVLELARRLRPGELQQRYRRALAEKRRYHGLRRLTNELLAKVRYVNSVAVSLRTGLLEPEAGAQEMALTEQQMVELVKQVKRIAGVEG